MPDTDQFMDAWKPFLCQARFLLVDVTKLTYETVTGFSYWFSFPMGNVD